MMTLRDLDRISPSRLLLLDRQPTNGPAQAGDKSIYENHPVVQSKVLFKHIRRRVQLKLWTVVGAQALILAGPKKWLPEGVPWFCRDDQDLCDLLIYQMEEIWGSDNYNAGDPGESLSAMCAMISRVTKGPPASALKPTEGLEGVIIDDLDLV